MAARQGGEYNVKREGGKGKERKGKGDIGNEGVVLAPRKNFLRAPMHQFISTKLVYRWKASHQNG